MRKGFHLIQWGAWPLWHSRAALLCRTRGLQKQWRHTVGAFLLRWWEAVLSSCLPGQTNIGIDCIKAGLERSRASKQDMIHPCIHHLWIAACAAGGYMETRIDLKGISHHPTKDWPQKQILLTLVCKILGTMTLKCKYISTFSRHLSRETYPGWEGILYLT